MTLDKVAEKRRVIRKRRGSIDFETAEAKIVLDKKGEPQGVRIRERTNATSLVEEAMLVANECVAQRLAQADMASAYRVHEPPIAERLESALVILHELELVNSEESAYRCWRSICRADGARTCARYLFRAFGYIGAFASPVTGCVCSS